MTTTGIIIGRFQVPHLHLGHIYLISTALRDCSKVAILLGTRPGQALDENNPYTAVHRLHIIQKIFPQVDVVILEDKRLDEVWSKQVDTICSSYFNPVLYHSRDSFAAHYGGKVPLHEIPELPGYSGTKLREEYVDTGSTPVGEPGHLRVA